MIAVDLVSDSVNCLYVLPVALDELDLQLQSFGGGGVCGQQYPECRKLIHTHQSRIVIQGRGSFLKCGIVASNECSVIWAAGVV